MLFVSALVCIASLVAKLPRTFFLLPPVARRNFFSVFSLHIFFLSPGVRVFASRRFFFRLFLPRSLAPQRQTIYLSRQSSVGLGAKLFPSLPPFFLNEPQTTLSLFSLPVLSLSPLQLVIVWRRPLTRRRDMAPRDGWMDVRLMLYAAIDLDVSFNDSADILRKLETLAKLNMNLPALISIPF